MMIDSLLLSRQESGNSLLRLDLGVSTKNTKSEPDVELTSIHLTGDPPIQRPFEQAAPHEAAALSLVTWGDLRLP